MEESERIAVLEAEIRHINKNLDAMSQKVTEMHEVLLQVKGARVLVVGTAAIAGALAGKLAALAGLFGFKAP